MAGKDRRVPFEYKRHEDGSFVGGECFLALKGVGASKGETNARYIAQQK